MVLRIGMNRYMALVQMRQLRLPGRQHGSLCNQQGNGRTLRLIILLSDIEHLGADHLGQRRQDLGQPL